MKTLIKKVDLFMFVFRKIVPKILQLYDLKKISLVENPPSNQVGAFDDS